MSFRRACVWSVACCWWAFFQLEGCLSLDQEPNEANSRPLLVGEQRMLELCFLRFDVDNFERALTRADLLALPAQSLDRVWLLDLDLSNGPNTPRLLDNALEGVKSLDPSTLSAPARNLQHLMTMTPDNADLRGTNLEELVQIAPLLGIAPEQVLARLLHINVEDAFLSSSTIVQSISEQVIASHPNAQKRLGPRNDSNPEGIYEVTQGALPVTLKDALTDFATFSQRFGPMYQDGVYHPGFIFGDTRARVLTDDFKVTVRANANALPYKGVDLTSASTASVNSIPSQIDQLFDFDDPNWLVIEGLAGGDLKIDLLNFRIFEDPRYIPGGNSPLPVSFGSSMAWQLAPWSLERVLIGASQRFFAATNTEQSYHLPGQTQPVFFAQVKDGWQEIRVNGGIGSPPEPSYIWDILLEVSQVRLHDGDLAEGLANVELALQDVSIGLNTESIKQSIRDNLQADPNALVELAAQITDNSSGEADFYYYRADSQSGPQQEGDWLFFITEEDIPIGDDGQRQRPYAYPAVGFFADDELTKKLSNRAEVDGDLIHEKVRIQPGDIFYIADDHEAVFRLYVDPKPSDNVCALIVTRIR